MRPAGLTAVCLIALIFGVLGGFGFVGGIATTFLQPVIMDLTKWVQGKVLSVQPAQMQKQLEQTLAGQEQLMRETVALQRGWLPLLSVNLLILGGAAVALVVGAVKGLGMKPRAHYWMIAGMTAGIVHALLVGYVGVRIQRETAPITQRYVNQTLQGTPGGANPAARMMANNMAQAGAAIGFAFVFGWALVKCATYITCMGFLLTPRIRKLFEGDGSDRAVIDALSQAPS